MTAYSPGFWLKSSQISCSSLKDRDFLITALFTNSSSSSYLSSEHLILLLSCWPYFGVACLIHLLLLFVLLSELTFTSSISSCVELSVIAVSGCFCSSATVHITLPSDPEAFSLTIPSSVEQNGCNSAGEGGGGGRHFPLDGPLEEQRGNCESLPLHGARGPEPVAEGNSVSEFLSCHEPTVPDNPNQTPRSDRAQQWIFTAIYTSCCSGSKSVSIVTTDY